MDYLIVGVHPESDSVWVARRVSCADLDAAYCAMNSLPEVDHGVGHYELWTESPLLPVDTVDHWKTKLNDALPAT